MGMNTAQARVIDPILTTHARGYSNPDVERAGRILMPRAPILQRGAKVIKFGKESFRLYNTRRAPGASRKRIQVGYAAEPVSLFQHSLSGTVPFEVLQEANQVPGIELGRKAVNTPMEAIAREEEWNQASVAQNVANYGANNKLTLSGTDQWSDDASNPGKHIDDAHQAIRSKIGRRGNVLVLGPEVYRAAKRHPKVIGHFYTGTGSHPAMVTREQLAAYFEVRRVVVGDDVYDPETGGDFDDIWGKVAILAYVPNVSGDGDIDVPSFGYTYYLSGHPLVESAWQDRDNDTWVYPTKDEYSAELTGMEAGFLLSDVVA